MELDRESNPSTSSPVLLELPIVAHDQGRPPSILHVILQILLFRYVDIEI